MEVRFSKDAAKTLQGMSKAMKHNIGARINGLTKTPPEGDFKPMKGYSDGRCRLRVGGYRIVYNYFVDKDERVLYIIDIGARGDIYK